MKKGKLNEHIVINWLKNYSREIIDFREFRLAQRIDVDCGIETLDGSIILAEIKSDNYISEKGNLFFECNRINHFVKDKWFYLGWGWRSPAQKLIIRNPENNEIYVFNFEELRIFVGKYISDVGKNLNTMIIETDEQKTTFGYLIPMHRLKEIYKSYYV